MCPNQCVRSELNSLHLHVKNRYRCTRIDQLQVDMRYSNGAEISITVLIPKSYPRRPTWLYSPNKLLLPRPQRMMLFHASRERWTGEHQVRGLREAGVAQRMLFLRHLQGLHGGQGLHTGKEAGIQKRATTKIYRTAYRVFESRKG